jgi:hypothetical protein
MIPKAKNKPIWPVVAILLAITLYSADYFLRDIVIHQYYRMTNGDNFSANSSSKVFELNDGFSINRYTKAGDPLLRRLGSDVDERLAISFEEHRQGSPIYSMALSEGVSKNFLDIVAQFKGCSAYKNVGNDKSKPSYYFYYPDHSLVLIAWLKEGDYSQNHYELFCRELFN